MIAVSDELIVRNIVEERSTIRGDLQKPAMTASFGRRRHHDLERRLVATMPE
jgi:hypothetical protein